MLIPLDLLDDAGAGRVAPVLLDFEISQVLTPDPGERFRALAHCPAHNDPSPSLLVTVISEPTEDAPAGALFHRCLAGCCSQDRVRAAIGREWKYWYPHPTRRHRSRRKSKPPELRNFAIEVRHRELLRQDDELAALRDVGITLDAIKTMRVGIERVALPFSRHLDRLTFYMQDHSGYTGRLLYLPKWRSTEDMGRKRVQGKQGVVMRRGGPAAGPVVVVEGALSALAAQSLGGEAIATPGTSWRFEAHHMQMFGGAPSVVVVGDSGDAGMTAAETWAYAIRKQVGDVRLVDLGREDNFDIADLLEEAGLIEASRHIHDLVVRADRLPEPRPGPRPTATSEARRFLRQNLENNPLPSKVIASLATEKGISRKTLRNAREALRIHSHRVDDEQGHRNVWFLPHKCSICLQSGYRDTPASSTWALGHPGQPDKPPANGHQDQVALVPSEECRVIPFPGARHG